jgi:hypothetical protein
VFKHSTLLAVYSTPSKQASLTTAPYVRSVQQKQRRKYQGLGKLRLCVVRSTLQQHGTRAACCLLPTTAKSWCQLYTAAHGTKILTASTMTTRSSVVLKLPHIKSRIIVLINYWGRKIISVFTNSMELCALFRSRHMQIYTRITVFTKASH